MCTCLSFRAMVPAECKMLLRVQGSVFRVCGLGIRIWALVLGFLGRRCSMQVPGVGIYNLQSYWLGHQQRFSCSLFGSLDQCCASTCDSAIATLTSLPYCRTGEGLH